MNEINLTVNGKPVAASAEPRTHLADFLRETLNLTGTHIGCEHGVCGACTLLIDGIPARSCITYAAACDNAEITTIEGLDEDEIATELRAAFSSAHGLQCGYCTPGMLVSARDVVLRMEAPSEHDIRVAMSGNLCRCTGYVGIIRAIRGVVEARRARGVKAVPDGHRSVLGPAGSGHAEAVAAPEMAASLVKTREVAPVTAAQPRAGAEIDAGWKPQTEFSRSFTVSHPPNAVWDFFGRIGEVASCLPGAALAGEPIDGHAEGHMKVRVGPIRAEFQGVADVTRDEKTRTGRIVGAGKDQRSNSATKGVVSYAVKPGAGPGETRVDVTIGYTLTGMLAQFGRSGLVQDVANRIIDAFTKNLETRMAGDDLRADAKEFNAGSLVSSVIIERINQFVAKLFGRKTS